MITYPNAKINIGLNVVSKREDGYHDIETLFYPLQLADKIVIEESSLFQFDGSGMDKGMQMEDNLIVKAYRLLSGDFNIPPVSIHLEKNIPIGAGLGGGSADAAYTILGLNQMFRLDLSKKKMIEYASQLGSDCAFFILNSPAFAYGRGELLEKHSFRLKGYSIVLIKPNVFVSTKQAYQGVTPKAPVSSLRDVLSMPIKDWQGILVNDFEESVFPVFPEIRNIKEKLYKMGANYASMSGSGSSVFGIFETLPEGINLLFPEHFIWTETCLY